MKLNLYGRMVGLALLIGWLPFLLYGLHSDHGQHERIHNAAINQLRTVHANRQDVFMRFVREVAAHAVVLSQQDATIAAVRALKKDRAAARDTTPHLHAMGRDPVATPPGVTERLLAVAPPDITSVNGEAATIIRAGRTLVESSGSPSFQMVDSGTDLLVVVPVPDRNEPAGSSGVLALRLDMGYASALLSAGDAWEQIGLGQTGDLFLIEGATPDTPRQRTPSRRSYPEQFFSSLRQSIDGGPQNQTVVTGTMGIHPNETMWVAAPLALPGLPSRWMLIVTLDEAEPRHELLAWRRIMWINTLVLMLVVGIAGAWLAHRIRHPIRRTMAILSASSTQIAAASNEQDRTTGQQLAALSEIVTTLEELAASARHSSEQGLLAAQRAAQGIQVSNDSAGTIQQLLGQMTTIRDKVQDIAQRILTLSEQTAQIREIAAAMTDFASETRMLSMNAAVEAVHAGEKGRGFAILAMETRKLAEESRLSARRIATLTDEIEQVMSSAVMVTDDGGKAADAGREQALHTTALMHEAATLMRDNAGSVQQIHRNIDQQSLAIQQLRDAIQSIHQGSREGVQGIAQIKNGLGALNQMLIHMKEIV